jgi:hypothetical protein
MSSRPGKRQRSEQVLRIVRQFRQITLQRISTRSVEPHTSHVSSAGTGGGAGTGCSTALPDDCARGAVPDCFGRERGMSRRRGGP